MNDGGYIVGFDPGTRFTGYAVFELDSKSYKIVECGVWNLFENKKRDLSLGQRLERLAEHTEKLLRVYNPLFVGIEKAVVFKNPASSLVLSEARGVIRLVTHQILSEAEKRILELSPTAVKKFVSGLGSTQKKGIKASVTRRFDFSFLNFDSLVDSSVTTPDTYDAIAVAYTVWSLVKRQKSLNLQR